LKKRLVVLLGFVLFIQKSVAQTQDVQSDPLQLTLFQTSKPTAFLINLHNSTNRDINIKIGITLGNGQKHYIDSVDLTLTTPDSRLLHLQPKGPAFIAGRIGPLIVPLPAGATFSFPLNLDDCISIKEKIHKVVLSPGHYQLEVQYTGTGITPLEANLDMKGITLMHLWTGTAKSPPLSFTVSADKQ